MIFDFQEIELLGKTVFKRVKFRPPLRVLERMEDEACLIYPLNGSTAIYGGTDSELVGPEEGMLMKCGSFISNWQLSESAQPYEAITIHFSPDVLQLIFENNLPDYLLQSPGGGNRAFHKIEQNAILKSYIDSLLVYFDNPSLFHTDTIKLKLKELIALLYQLDSNGIREILADLFNPHEVEFKKAVTEHLFHDLSLEEFAALTHVSVSTFRRRFKAMYGASPGKYIIGKKLERASELLATSGRRVSEVCYECGFGDLSNFSKAFSKKYGVSPSSYQRQHTS